MINRGNWILFKKYLVYRQEVDQVSPKTLRNEETWLTHVLEWADEKPFQDAPKIRPIFPQYLLTASLEDQLNQLSAAYTKKIIRSAHRFFRWLSAHQRGYRGLNAEYLDTLKAPRMIEPPREREYVSFAEIVAISKASARTIKDRRIRAAAVFLWLSGMRVGAFASLPLDAVSIEHLEIKQWPSMGVRTKNTKFAVTFLLNIPELLDVVKEWDNEVRRVLPAKGLWFAPLLPSTGEFDLSVTVESIGENRSRIVARNLGVWLDRVGLPYHSPHKFRHGFANYVKKHSRSIGDLEALRENLMHSNLQVTDGMYGIFSKNDVKERLHGLSASSEIDSLDEIPPQDREFVLALYRLYVTKQSN